MGRLIDADKLAKDINDLSTHPLNEWDTMGVLMRIDKQPTVDAEPVRHGRWVELEHAYECSFCGVIRHKGVTGYYAYCPNCGSKMDKEEEDEAD